MRIASRAAAPAQMQPWLDDRRRLGVRVSRVRAAGAGPARGLPLDAPMSGGWWGVEQDAKGPFRWTTGDAILPLPGGTALVMLSVAPLASGYPTG
jgi:hypothetical protein